MKMKYKHYPVLKLEQKTFDKININDNIFDSFKKDYPGFEEWFLKKQKSKEIGWVYIDPSSKEVQGFLYLKLESIDENYQSFNPVFKKARRLKIGTFKITKNGFKMGERFLKVIFDHAKINEVSEIYVTIFDNSREKLQLINLLETYGFEKWGDITTTKELVYVKKLYYEEKFKDSKKNFPFVDFQKASIYLLPIKPKYHTNLLPDCILTNENPDLYKNDWPWMYAIKKYYIGDNLFNTEAKEGDIVLFYRMKDENPLTYARHKSVVTGIGIILKISNINSYDRNDLLNRSVLTEKELLQFKKPKVLEFLFLDNFIKRTTLNFLWEKKILTEPKGPRQLHKISKEQFYKILENSKYNLG